MFIVSVGVILILFQHFLVKVNCQLTGGGGVFRLPSGVQYRDR